MKQSLVLRSPSPFEPDVLEFIRRLDEYQQSLYPAESNHLDSPTVLAEPNCKFLGAYHEGTLVGIGAAKMGRGYGELKRFFVSEEARGMGVAECIIQALEDWLIENGIYVCHLETGIYQPAAIRFYSKLGYKESIPFGPYKPDPLSVFMTKELEHPRTT